MKKYEYIIIEKFSYNTEEGRITIVFKNNKFEYCDFLFKGLYNRKQWKLLAEIESEIEKIEQEKTVKLEAKK